MRKVVLRSVKKLAQYAALSAALFVMLVQLVNAEIKVFHITIDNHVFTPNEITIPANEKVKIIIENKDDVAEEFDSFDLNRERVIFAGKKATIYVGPLTSGRYEYFGEYNPNSARGYVIVADVELEK